MDVYLLVKAVLSHASNEGGFSNDLRHASQSFTRSTAQNGIRVI